MPRASSTTTRRTCSMPPGELALPGRGALEPVGGADVVHEVAVDVADEGLGVEVLGQQLGVGRAHAAVAADVEVPPPLGGDDADVLALGLGALPGAARHGELDLVRRPQAPVAQLEVDGELHRVLHAVAAPHRADARLHRAHGLAVGVAGLEAGGDEPRPDRRELLDPGAEEVDALAAGDLRVEVEVAGDLADDDELLGRDLAAGHAGHDRVGAVALEVGEEVVVGVLQRRLLAVEDVRRRRARRTSTPPSGGRSRSPGRCRGGRRARRRCGCRSTRTTSKSSARVIAKCGHSRLTTSPAGDGAARRR